MLPDNLPENPVSHFARWFEDAHERNVTDNPNAMIVGSVDTHYDPPRPSARVVLCKAIDEHQGFVVFYTNYESRKGEELLHNPNCSAVFHWDRDERQVRLEGIAVRSPATESDAYYASRHPGSRIGAWASNQSRELESRAALLSNLAAQAKRFNVPMRDGLEADNVDVDIPRPPHWGGYRLWIRSIELWSGDTHRVHDRARFTRELEMHEGNVTAGTHWHAARLQP